MKKLDVFYPETIDDLIDVIKKYKRFDIHNDNLLYLMRICYESRPEDYKYLRGSGIFSYLKLYKFYSMYGTDKNDLYPKGYPYIPHDSPSFVSMFLESIYHVDSTYTGGKLNFIDAGSGIGLLSNLVYKLFYGMRLTDKFQSVNSTALEYCKDYIKIGKFLFPGDFDFVRFIEGDITTFDFNNYNLIYAYNPIDDVSGMERFFRNVIMTARNNTICIFSNVHTGNIAMKNINKTMRSRKIGYFEKINDYLFRVVK